MRFNLSETVYHPVDHLHDLDFEEISECWYLHSEWEGIKAGVSMAIKAYRRRQRNNDEPDSVLKESDDFTFRGIEQHVPNQERKELKKAMMWSIQTAQEQIWKGEACQSMPGASGEEILAMLSHKLSSPSRAHARHVGQQDEWEVYPERRSRKSSSQPQQQQRKVNRAKIFYALRSALGSSSSHKHQQS